MAITPDDIDDKAEELLSQPKSVTGDGVSQTNLTPADLDALDRRTARKSASGFGFRIKPMKPPEH